MRVVTVCGSGRFKDSIHRFCNQLSSRGLVVLAPPLHNIDQLTSQATDEGKLLTWKGATFAHLNRIATADVCIVMNPGGYIGASSTLELGYAIALKKLVIAFQHDEELAREGLFDIVIETDDYEVAAKKIAALLIEGKGWTNVISDR